MPDKVRKVMHEFKEGELHSGSKSGPRVTKREQAVAIGMSEQRKADRGRSSSRKPKHSRSRSMRRSR